MTYQTDVKAKNLTATGAAGLGTRIRVKGMYFLNGTTAGSVSFRQGGASGIELIKLDTTAVAANANGTNMLWIPGEGVLFDGDPYVTLTNVTSITFFYG